MTPDHQCEVIESDSSSKDVQCGERSSPKETERAQRLLALQQLTNDRAQRLLREGLQKVAKLPTDP